MQTYLAQYRRNDGLSREEKWAIGGVRKGDFFFYSLGFFYTSRILHLVIYCLLKMLKIIGRARGVSQ